MKLQSISSFLAIMFLFIGSSLIAQDQVGEMTMDREEGIKIFRKPSYSPYAGRNFPTQVYWGDTHLHTKNYSGCESIRCYARPC